MQPTRFDINRCLLCQLSSVRRIGYLMHAIEWATTKNGGAARTRVRNVGEIGRVIDWRGGRGGHEMNATSLSAYWVLMRGLKRS